MQAEYIMTLTASRKWSWGYKNPWATLCLHTGRRTPLKKFKQHGKKSSKTLEFLLAKTLVKIANEDTNNDTRYNPQLIDNLQTQAQGPTAQHNPRQAERSQEQGFRAACRRYWHQQHVCCIEDSRDPEQNIGRIPGNPGTYPDFFTGDESSKHNA